MRKVFEEIGELIELDKPTVSGIELEMSLHFCKLGEEFGELATAVNKLNGRKSLKKGETKKEVLDNLEEEGADTIQCVIAILIKAGVNYDSLKKRLKEKNKVYRKAIK